MTTDTFDFPRYTKTSPHKTFVDLPDRSGILFVNSLPVDKKTGEALLDRSFWHSSRGAKFRNTVHLKPEPRHPENPNSADWAPTFSFDLSPADFWTLHSLTSRVRQVHEQAMQDSLSEPVSHTINAEGPKFCFQTTYCMVPFQPRFPGLIPLPTDKQIFRPVCTGIGVYLKTPTGDRIDIGTLTLFSAFESMARLMLDVDRVAAMLQGEPLSKVAAISKAFVPEDLALKEIQLAKLSRRTG